MTRLNGKWQIRNEQGNVFQLIISIALGRKGILRPMKIGRKQQQQQTLDFVLLDTNLGALTDLDASEREVDSALDILTSMLDMNRNAMAYSRGSSSNDVL